MNVLIVSPGQDTAGIGYRTKQAFDRFAPEWTVRAVHVTDTYIKYPSDLKFALSARVPGETRAESDRRLRDDMQELRQLYDEADVVHHNNALYFYPVLDGRQRKPTVHHHHGSRLRQNPKAAFAEGASIGAVPLVSTVDLLADAPGATWMPAPYDLDGLRDHYATRKGPGIRIGHAPTVRKAKNTVAILAALGEVCKRRRDVEVDLIEGVEWRVCLSHKARCHIFIDQLTLGYGCNGVEAMAMGIPVISSWEDPADRQRFIDATGELPPFLEADADDLEAKVLTLVRDPELREQLGMLGRAFVERWHGEAKVVEMMKKVYENAPQSKGVRYFKPYNERNLQSRIEREMERERVA